MTENPDYLIYPNGEPLAESLWVEGERVFNSLKFIPPYLLVVKIRAANVDWETPRRWSTYIYQDLMRVLQHLERKCDYEHRLYLLNNQGEISKLSLIRSIRRMKNKEGNDELVFMNNKISKVLACPAPDELIGKERKTGAVYSKSYPPGHDILPES